MKRSIYLLLILSIVAVFSISSCSEKDNERRETEIPNKPNKPNDNTKSCWEFAITVKISIKGVSIPGYPQTATTTTKKCDMTEKEAEEFVENATTTSSSTVQGITATVESTCTKRRL